MGACPNARGDDWPTLHHDLARSGRTEERVGPPFEQAWVAVFAEEIITTRTEPIVAGGRVFVGTYSGRMRALDAETGDVLWTQDLTGPILHSPSVEGETLYAASMAGVFALDAATGQVRWHYPEPREGYCTSPAVTGGLVLLGGRDGVFRALDAATGKPKWQLATDGPIRTTAAVADGTVYFASDDMRVYAADLATGKLQWRSEKVYGQTLRDYYPMVIGDRLLIQSNPAVHFAHRIHSDTAFLCKQAGLPDNHWQTVAEYLKTDRIFADKATIRREQEAIRQYLEDNPQAQSCFLLDRKTGKRTVVPPVMYVGGCAGVANPPAITADGRAAIMFRSAYSNFTDGVAPLVALGYLDVDSGWIEPIYHKSGQRPPWGTFWGTADEAQNFCIAGNLLLFCHQGTLTALNLETEKLLTIAGKRDTWGGLPAAGWTLNEWHGPARGGVAVVGHMLYWITGSRVIAVRGSKP